MLPKRHRLRKPHEYTAVLRAGAGSGARRARTPRLVVHGRRMEDHREAAPAQVGFVVSSAVGNSVVRHRLTRRLRGLMATRIATYPAGTDLVVRANPVAARATSDVLAEDIDRCVRKVLT